MKIIPEALPLAKLQRTSMNEKQMIRSYEADFRDVKNHTQNIENYKEIWKIANNEKIGKVLDIGCGIAGWESFLKDSNFKIYLLDKTKVDENVYYGYKKKGSFYSSLSIAMNNLLANGIDKENIFVQEATEDNKILFEEKFDLIVSFISCGFHYPVETYLDEIYEKLKDGGVLIIDVRKGTDAIGKLSQKFKHVHEIKEENKYFRVKAIK